MTTQLIKFEVNQPFPLPVPTAEGATMELWDSGLVVLIQMPGLSTAELIAFQKSFTRYSYLESSAPAPIALWVFDFPGPHGPIETPFNGVIVRPDRIDNFLNNSDGVKNMAGLFSFNTEELFKMGRGFEF